MKDIKRFAEQLEKDLREYKEADECGWFAYPKQAPDEPEHNPDDMPQRSEYTADGLGAEAFMEDRADWINRHLDQFIVWEHGADAPTLLFWGGNNYEWFDDDMNHYTVDAWQELPEKPTFVE